MVIQLEEGGAHNLNRVQFQLPALPFLIGFCVFNLSLSLSGSVLKL